MSKSKDCTSTTSPEEKLRLVAIGRIVRPHGVQGAVKVFPYGETLGLLESGERLYVSAEGSAGGCWRRLMVLGGRVQGKLWVVELEGLSSREEAEALQKAEISVPADRLPKTEEGEYYHYQLIGLAVETLDGKPLGVLRSIIETGGNDVYVVEGEGREVLIPAIEEVIREVDLERGRMRVDLPEGLLE